MAQVGWCCGRGRGGEGVANTTGRMKWGSALYIEGSNRDECSSGRVAVEESGVERARSLEVWLAAAAHRSG